MGEIKKIKVSNKRQITIPAEFFEKLGIEKAVECFINEMGEMVIRPEKSDYFAEEILQDLINQGYEKQQLVKKFKEMNNMVRPAVSAMIIEAETAAKNYDGIDHTDEVFGD
ncbi:MAG TPA: AbrB family transcriptional regulator [Firmicutes bacterium]|nr:AbrB family transcriptional regulator [Bacillota bacterium]